MASAGELWGWIRARWDTATVERWAVAVTPNHGLLWDAYAARGGALLLCAAGRRCRGLTRRAGAAVFEILAKAKLDMIASVQAGAPDCSLLGALFDSWRSTVLSQ